MQTLKVDGMDCGGKLMIDRRTAFIRSSLRCPVVKATAEHRAVFFKYIQTTVVGHVHSYSTSYC